MINLGIIGTNWITHDYVTHAQATGKFTLRGVYSRKQDTATEFASKYPAQQSSIALYTSLDDLANDANLDTIYIASPNLLHYEQAKKMLLAGKNVIVEKPSCSTSAELADLFKIADEKKVVLIEAFRHIQEKNFKVLKKSMELLGPICGASITMAQYSSRYEKVLQGETPNIFNLDMGGGALPDMGVYPVSAAVDLFGAPKEALYWPVKIRTGADGGGRLILTYDNFVVHLYSTKMNDSDAPSEIYGEKGTLSVPSITDIESVKLWDPRKKTRTELGGKKEELNLKEEAEEHARVIEGKDWDSMKHYEKLSKDILRVMEKVRKDNGLLFPMER